MKHARLRHDLGKYLARTARNVDAHAPLDAELLAMLCDDLYATYDGERASRVFARLVGAHGDAAFPAVRAALQELDTLEPAVRRGDATAVRRAITLACRVAEVLQP